MTSLRLRIPIILAMMTTGIIFPVIGALIGFLKEYHPTTPQALALIPMYFEGGFIVGMLIFPGILNLLKQSHRKSVLLGITTIGSTNLLVAASNPYSAPWYLGLICLGISAAMLLATTDTLIMVYTRYTQQSGLFSANHGFVNVGNLFFLASSFLLLNNRVHFNTSLLLPFFFSVLIFVSILFWPREALAIAEPKRAVSISNYKLFALICIVGGMTMSIEVVTINMTALIFKETVTTHIPLLIGFFYLGGAIGRWLSARISKKRSGDTLTLLALFLGILVTVVCFYLLRNFTSFFILGVLVAIPVPILLDWLSSTHIASAKGVSRYWLIATMILLALLYVNARCIGWWGISAIFGLTGILAAMSSIILGVYYLNKIRGEVAPAQVDF